MTFSLFEDPSTADDSLQPVDQQPADDSDQTVVLACTEKSTHAPEVDVASEVAGRYQLGLEAAISTLASLEEAMTGDYGHGFNPFRESHQRMPCINGLTKTLFKTIIKDARQTGLAAPGDYSIEGEFDQYITGLSYHGGDSSHDKVILDIKGLCSAIFKNHGGDAGKKIEHRRVANLLIRRFGLMEQEINVKAGTVELKSHCYLTKRYNGNYEFHHSTQAEMSNALNALEHVFQASGLDVDVDEIRDSFRDYQFYPVPNKTTLVGQIGEFPMTVKVFKSELRWKFTEQCIAILSDFISEYGTAS